MSRNPKRKLSDMNDRNPKKKRHKPMIKLENAPPVNSIHDLIEIGKSIRFYKNLDTIMLWRIAPYLEELDKMIGMKTLKESILYQIIYYLKGMHTKNRNEEYLHTIIMGPPGHGKTVVARIMGKIYQSMGVLSPSGPFKVAYRDDFIAAYLGQTAIKTRKLLNSCIGGVLFVDELYSLAPRQSDRDSFSDEAIETITGFLSNHKNDFCFIGAGYEDDIVNRFLAKNKGLRRRFQWIHKIQPYKSEELADIMIKMISGIDWQIGFDKKELISCIDENKDLFKFAGGDVGNFLSKCKIVHAKRVFSLDKEHSFVLTKKDLENGIKIIKKNSPTANKDECKFLPMYM